MNTPRLFLPLLFIAGALHADVVPAPLFTDHAVLQRDKPIPVWGKADPGEKVSVTFAGTTLAVTADSAGAWRVDLPARPANATPDTLTIAGNNTIVFNDILVGDVWLASGQSNMEWVVKNTYDASLDIAGSSTQTTIRQFKVAKKTSDVDPLDTAAGDWKVAGPTTTGDFTAAGYFFARDLQAVLGVPIGIINSSWGGTPVEAWIDPESLGADPDFAVVYKRKQDTLDRYPEAKVKYDADLAAWKAEKAAAEAAGQAFTKRAPNAPQGPGHSHMPCTLNNAMIHPLLPYGIRGAIWYQGESNAGRASEYNKLFAAMITGWRRQFGQGDFPFYWVQLANYASGNVDGTAWAFLREAQTKTLSLPNTGQAVIIDIGNVTDIHPRNKLDVGRRLARLALHRTYGIDLIDSGPVFASATREGAGYRIAFEKSPSPLIAPLNSLSGFELAGEDKVFKPATAKIEGDTVVVSSPDVTEPVAVRYAWRHAPVAGLFNREGLPAVPFRTDDWN